MTNNDGGDHVEASRSMRAGSRLLSRPQYLAVLLLLVATLIGSIYASQVLVPPDRRYTYSGGALLLIVLILIFSLMWFRQEKEQRTAKS